MEQYFDKYRLDHLFSELGQATSEEEILSLESAIWEVWMDARSTTINAKMEEGTAFMEDQDFYGAIMVFDEMIERWADYAEGWNKRATAYYQNGEFKRALDDIEKALALEPRHFGALSGKANIYREICYDEGVIKTLKELQKLMPGKEMLNKQIAEVASRMNK